MTTINQEEVQKVGHLARLDIPESELDSLSKELTDILNYIERLSTVDTEGIEPLASSLISEGTPIRPDSEDTSDTIQEYRKNINKNAPDMEGSFIKVPKMSKS